jgi:hypothetical protein
MAKNKKSVLLYCDLIHTIEKLTDKNAGLFFKHYLRYVNDQDPKPPNAIIDLVFENTKQTLKRDLKVYEGKCLKNKESAQKRWDANACERKKRNAKHADSGIDNDSDNDNDKEIKNYKEDSFNSWWLMYDNKKGLSKSKAKFLKLSDNDIQAILKITPLYVSSTPDIKYRKLPLTWLNGEHWNDDLTTKKKKFINPCF